jgi:hypothetical protein
VDLALSDTAIGIINGFGILVGSSRDSGHADLR